jgi:basic membrane protein A
VAAQGTDNSEVTGGLDAFALGVESVNPDATVYVVVTNSWYDPDAEEAASRTLLDMGCDVMAQHCDRRIRRRLPRSMAYTALVTIPT